MGVYEFESNSIMMGATSVAPFHYVGQYFLKSDVFCKFADRKAINIQKNSKSLWNVY